MEKIYITSLHLMHGGVEMAITLLANALCEKGYDVEILCTYNLGEPVYSLNKEVKVRYLTSVHPNKEEIKAAIRQKNPLRLFKEGIYALNVLRLKKKTIKNCFRDIKQGTIISTRNEHSVLLSRFGNKGVKKIAQLHHDHCFDKKLVNDFKNNYGNIDYFLLLTDRLTEEVKEIMAKNRHTRILTMPNFLEDCACDLTALRRRQIITVGRLHPVKGFDRLIKLWKDIEFKEPTVLKIVGDGDERPKLEALIKENGLEEKVILTGALPHEKVMEEMSQSLFYVMTSLSEGFGFVLVEAMQMGLPCIAFDVRVGPETIIEEGKSGFLVADNDNALFRERVLYLAENEDTLKEMSQNAISRSQAFSKENIISKWIEILEN